MSRCVGMLSLVLFLWTAGAGAETLTADNGNGTYTNPLFYDEFSTPT